jgi:hypothetical protein
MKYVFGDFETYYTQDYSLRKMTPVEYILDPRFEANGCAFKEGMDGPAFWVDGPDLQAYFNSLDPNNTAFISHNALFDACICAWRFGFVPRLISDTMGIARALIAYKVRSMSLDSVSQHLGLGVKGKTLLKVIGMNLSMIKAAGLYDEYVAYGKDDVEKCAGIWKALVASGKFPVSELVIMDMVLRCAVIPRFHLDRTLLAEHLHSVQQAKASLLANAEFFGADGKADLMSNEKFANLLRRHGVEPPLKNSALTGKVTYAFAKTDEAFLELQDHPDPAVQTLVEARLGTKSTIEETRTQKLISIGNLVWPENSPAGRQAPFAPFLPVPLRFSGAHTHRLSGDWSLNLQNLPVRNGLNTIRRALVAPEGYKVLAPDASQIEARIVGWIAGQDDLTAQFRAGEDVYALFAGDIFQRQVDKKRDPGERFLGKTGILQLGFQCGWAKFQWTVAIQSANTPTPMTLHDEQAQHIVNVYRSRYSKIRDSWGWLQGTALPTISGALDNEQTFGPCIIKKGSILLPNGLSLYYHDLQCHEGQWKFTFGGKPKWIYGGGLLENIVQALARIIVMEAGVRIRQRTQEAYAMQVHDELVYIVKDEHVDLLKTIAMEEMARPPSWAPDLPLASEAGIGQSYGDAK